MYSGPLPIFFNWWFISFGVSFVSPLYILDINALSDILMNILSHSVDCLFILLMVSFAVQKLFSLMYSVCFLFSSLVWGDISDKILL